MSEDEDKCTACPECGCASFNHRDELGDGYRVCLYCGQEWWTDIDYDSPNMPTPYQEKEDE